MARIIALAPTVPLVEAMRSVIVIGSALALMLAHSALPHL